MFVVTRSNNHTMHPGLPHSLEANAEIKASLKSEEEDFEQKRKTDTKNKANI